MASPQTIHGRYSKYLPTRLAGKYQEAKADTELLALRDEVALIDARLAELVQRVDTGESQSLWVVLQDLHRQLMVAVQVKDTGKMSATIRRIGEIIEAGSADNKAWGDIFEAVEQRRKVVESERKRLVEMQQMITSERAMLLISALVGIVQSHVTDAGTLEAISTDVGKLVNFSVQ